MSRTSYAFAIALALCVPAAPLFGCRTVRTLPMPPARGARVLVDVPGPPQPPSVALRWHEAAGEVHLEREVWWAWLRYMTQLHGWRDRAIYRRRRPPAAFFSPPDPRPAERPPLSRPIGRLRASF